MIRPPRLQAQKRNLRVPFLLDGWREAGKKRAPFRVPLQTADKASNRLGALIFYNFGMLKPACPAQTELEMVTLEQLVPKDHLLRLLDQHIRFDFIREATQHLYCENNGRPAIDPVVLFKMLFIGYLFGIRSERRLVKEIEVNVAYRWFLGFRLTDKVKDWPKAPKPAAARY